MPEDALPSTDLSCTRWPFQFVVDHHGRPTGWTALHAPVVSPDRQALFARHRREGRGFVGLTSYLTFPALDDPAVDWGAVCAAWGHTFRDPDRYLPPDRPRALLALSDFTDPDVVSPAAFPPGGDRPRFDVVHVAADEPWKQAAKGWDVARRCLEALGRAGRRCLVVGAPAGTPVWARGLTLWPRLPHGDFLRVLAGAGALLLTSGPDPSPRVLGEALCLDVPVLVPATMLGGWQYVEPATGRFFTDETDVVAAFRALFESPLGPRAWWRAHQGPEHAGRRLRVLIEQVDDGPLPAGPFGLDYALSGAPAGRD